MGRLKLSLFIIFACILLTTTSVYADKKQDVVTISENIISRIAGEKIPQGDTISRRDFVKFICHITGLDAISTEEQLFNDVNTDVDIELNGYLKVALEKGLITASDTFRPDEAITSCEALTIALRTAGYGITAEVSGGYPTGYLKIANNIGITKYFDVNQVFDSTQCKILVHNMLFSPVVRFDGNEYKQTEFTLLEVLYGYKYTEGILNANDATSLVAGTDSLVKGRILVGNVLLEVNDEFLNFAKENAGYNVRVVYKENDDSNEALFIVPFNNTVIPLDYSDTIHLDGSVIIAENEQNEKKYGLDIGYKLIYNGKKENLITDVMLNPESGNVRLIDNDNDGKYEIVAVEKYDYMKIGMPNTVTNQIPDSTDGKNTLDLSNGDCVYEIYDVKTKEVLTFADLTDGSYVAVKKSTDGLLVYIYVLSETISGEITYADDDYVKINDVQFRYISDFTKKYNYGIAGLSGMFFLGLNNEIIAFESTSDIWRYGYFSKIAQTDNFGTVKAKIFDEFGEWKTYVFAEKVRIDGVMLKSDDFTRISALLQNSEGKIIRFIASDDILKGLDTPAEATDFGLSAHMEEDNRLTEFAFTTDGYYYTNSSKSFYPNFSAANSKVFYIPENKSYENKFRITDNSVFPDRATLNVIPYDVDKYGMAKIILFDNQSNEDTYDMNGSSVKHMIIEKTGVQYDEEEGTLQFIEGWSEGKFVKYVIDPDVTVSKASGSTELVPGDIIKYHLADKVTVDHIIVDFDGETFKNNTGANTSAYNSGVTNVMQLSGGTAYTVGTNTITLIPDGSTENWKNIKSIYFPGNNIVVFGRKSKTLRPGTRADIKGYLEYGVDACFIVVRQSYHQGQQIFVYEK